MVKHINVSLENDPNYEPQGQVVISNDPPIAGSVMRAALICREEMHHEENEKEEDDIVDGETSFEDLRNEILLASERGDWNANTQSMARIALESIALSVGFEQNDTVVAASHALAGEEVTPTVALEAIDDILAAMSDHVSAGYGRLKQSLLASLGHIASAIPHLEDKWRKLEVKLHHEAHDPEGNVPTSGFYKRLLHQGKWPEQPGRYWHEYAEHVEQICTSFDHKAQEAVIRNADLLAAIEYQSTGDFEQSYKHAADGWVDPRKELSKEVMEFIVPGGDPFFTTKSTSYKGDNKAIRFFDTYATKNIPAQGRYGNLLQMRKYESIDGVAPLSLRDMRELCKVFMDVTERVKLEQRTAGEALAHAQVKAEFFAKRRATADTDVKSGTRDAYKYLDKAYGMTYELGQMKYNVLSTFVKVSNALFTYMERSLKPEAAPKGAHYDEHGNHQYTD